MDTFKMYGKGWFKKLRKLQHCKIYTLYKSAQCVHVCPRTGMCSSTECVLMPANCWKLLAGQQIRVSPGLPGQIFTSLIIRNVLFKRPTFTMDNHQQLLFFNPSQPVNVQHYWTGTLTTATSSYRYVSRNTEK